MLNQSTKSYEEINGKIKDFHGLYQNIYSLYETMSRADFHMSQNFWKVLFDKLNELTRLHSEIEMNVSNMDAGLKMSLEGKLNHIEECMTLVDHCLNNDHIKNNWVRLRVWISGHYDDRDNFICDSFANAGVCSQLNLRRAYVGHVSLETASGYVSFWPAKNAPHIFSSLGSDKCDEGPDADYEHVLPHKKRKREPDFKFVLYGLDVNKMDDFCRTYVREETVYKLEAKNRPSVKSKLYSDDRPRDNCITAVMKILKAGMVDVLAPEGQKEFGYNLTGVIIPTDFAKLLSDAKKREVELYPLTAKMQTQEIVEPAIFKAGTMIVVSQKDYQKKYNHQLSVKAGEKLVLEKVKSSESWYCRNHENQYGIVPSEYLCFEVEKRKSQLNERMSLEPAESLSFHEALTGLTYQPISLNGHCLFTAICLQMGASVNFLRESVARYLTENAEKYKNLRPGTQEDFNRYIESIRNGKEWGDIIEIQIIQDLLQTRPIIVIRPDSNPIIPDLNKYKEAPIFIYYNGYDHYDTFKVEGNADPKEILRKIQICIKENQALVFEPYASDEPAALEQESNRNTRSSLSFSV